MLEKLEGQRIIMRPLKTDDLDAVFRLMHEYPDIDEMFPLTLVSELIIKRHFEMEDTPASDTESCLLILDKEGNILGNIAVFKGARYVEGFEVGFHIFRPALRGKGYMTEALQVLMNYLFTKKRVLRLQLNVHKGNIGSRRVAEKCGFTYDGIMRSAILSGDQWFDLEMFSLLREEWEKL